MYHPRDLYIRAMFSLGRLPTLDYFSNVSCSPGLVDPSVKHDPVLFLGSQDKPKVQALARVISGAGGGSENIEAAMALFLDINNRITLDGLLLYKGVDEVARIKQMNKGVVNAYHTYFFNTKDFKELNSQLVFMSLITDDAALLWFNTCSRKSNEELKFALTGEYTITEDALADLRKIRSKAAQNYYTFGDFPANALLDGITPAQARAITLAQKEASLAIKAVQIENGSNDLLEQVKKFFKDMKMDVIEDAISQYDKPLPGTYQDGVNIEDDLSKQYNIVSPMSIAEDSDLPDDDSLIFSGE